jgi:hypothetical protein
MSNHVRLVAIPRKPDALARALKQPHGRYASYCGKPGDRREVICLTKLANSPLTLSPERPTPSILSTSTRLIRIIIVYNTT